MSDYKSKLIPSKEFLFDLEKGTLAGSVSRSSGKSVKFRKMFIRRGTNFNLKGSSKIKGPEKTKKGKGGLAHAMVLHSLNGYLLLNKQKRLIFEPLTPSIIYSAKTARCRSDRATTSPVGFVRKIEEGGKKDEKKTGKLDIFINLPEFELKFDEDF